MITLVTGPTRSGKSEWAEYLAEQSEQPIVYLATAQTYPDDPDWQARLELHRQRRPEHWQLLEIPIEISQALSLIKHGDFVLIDALGTWVTNLLDRSEAEWESLTAEFLTSLEISQCNITIVGEEVGWGLVPAYATGRLFRDRLGKLVRQVGTIADRVYLVTGGYVLDLTVLGQKLPQ